MSGFGRTGKWWGFQHYDGVVPDIMTSAKGLSASVIPVAMVGVSSPIKNYFDKTSPGWGSTFHAHSVALACAFATMKHMVDHDVVGHVQKMDGVSDCSFFVPIVDVFLILIFALLDFERGSVSLGRRSSMCGERPCSWALRLP